MSLDGIPMNFGSNGINTSDMATATATASSTVSVSGQDSRLANLPRELLDHVSSSLTTPEFNNLRLTCKLIEIKIFSYWSNAFFKKKQFMITAFSLQALVDISRHATLGPCLNHLVIGLDYLNSLSQDIGRSLDDYQQCKLASDSQESLLDTGVALRLLSTALCNLRNLKTINVRDFNSNTRYRDYIPSRQSRARPSWKSYGYSELPQWSRYLTENHGLSKGLAGRMGDCAPFVDRVFKVLLAALDQSACPIHGLETVFRFGGVALTDGAFAVTPLLDRTAAKLPTVLLGLTKLHLDLDMGFEGLPSASPYVQPFDHTFGIFPKSITEVCDPATTNLRKFLSLTPNLTWLRLNHKKNIYNTAASRLLSWLALNPEKPFGANGEAGWSDINPKPVSLPLRTLDLGWMSLHPNILGHALEKFGQLESLSFREVCLRAGPGEDQQHRSDDKNHGCMWARFLQKLPFFAPNLKVLHLVNLKEFPQRPTRHQPTCVIFQSVLKDNQDHITSYTLKLAVADKSALESLADRTWTEDGWRAAKRNDHFPNIDSTSMGVQDDGLTDIEDSTEVNDEDGQEYETVGENNMDT